jgi:glycine cleavage system protein P-like pyridoxal-binding family
MRDNLERQLRYLDEYAEHGDRGKTCCRLYRDGAPYSFGFVMSRRGEGGIHRNWFNGGLLFHGPHDGGGDGSAPTYAVCLQPTVGWSIHT